MYLPSGVCPQNRRRTRDHNFVYEAGTASCLEWSLFGVEKREQLTLHTYKLDDAFCF
jgi:hypothetical protein